MCVALVFSLIVAMVPMVSAEQTYMAAGEVLTQAEKEEADRMIAQGYEILQNGGKTRASYYLNVPNLYQNGSDWWANQLMACGHAGHTYAAVGCAMTSYAMVFRYYDNAAYTPVDIANTAQRVCVSCCNFSSGPLCSAYGHSRTLLDSDAGLSQASIEAGVIGGLANGRPSVLRLSKNGGNHFGVVKGFDEDHSSRVLYINDPEIPEYTTLQQFYNTGWHLDFACVIIR